MTRRIVAGTKFKYLRTRSENGKNVHESTVDLTLCSLQKINSHVLETIQKIV